MFFILSKTLGILAAPSNLLGLLIAAGLILYWTRWSRTGRRVLIFCVVLFLLIGALPFGRTLIAVLEDRFPAWTDRGGSPPDGIIILGGPINLRLSKARGAVQLGEAVERFTVIPALARQYPNARIAFTGGNANLGGGTPEAVYAVQLLESLGIPRDRLIIEDKSRNTAENASFTQALIAPKPGERWLLVTSAAHMPRAIGAFRQAGFSVEAYPVDWQTEGGNAPWWHWLMPSRHVMGGWGAFDDAAKEWVGLVAYRLAGQTSELLPKP